ncbi:MAG: response regulator [Alphaproteobacteria bacterium]|nr:response regulator [Alphaproteobacteria bacterium]
MTKILVVDDEDLLRRVLKTALEQEGFVVDTAENGVAALQCMADDPADLVLTDIIMPDKEGIELILTLRKLYSEARIIAMTGGGRLGPKDLLGVAERFGADSALSKPFALDALVALIRRLDPNAPAEASDEVPEPDRRAQGKGN